VLLQQPDDLRSRPVRVTPDPAQELKIDLFVAPFRHVRSRSVAIGQTSLHHAPETKQTRHIQEDDRVAMSDAEFKRPAEVAVDDPRVTTDQIGNSSHPFFFRRFGPTRSPVEAVKMLDFDIEQFTQAPGEG